MTEVFIVISKKTGNIMAVYSNYVLAAAHWNIKDFNILAMPVTGK